MPLDREYLESLGLEIAKRKYYNASKVESVITGFSERAAALESENASLRERMEALSAGREEIGDAILSAKTIARQLIAAGRDMSLAYRQGFVGQTVEVLCEEQEDSLSHGYTREYVACAFSGGVPGQICRVAVTGVTEDGLTGYMA